MSESTRLSLKCSDQFRAFEASPAGTTPRFSGLLLVELPQPWPKDVYRDPRLEAVAARCVETRHRLQAVVPQPSADAGSLRAVRFSRSSSGSTGFVRTERSFPHQDLDEAVAELLAEPVSDRAPAEGVTDVLICTHGTRDRCCGSSGTKLHQQVVAAQADAQAGASADASPEAVRVWRTSHLGGHRFAPTALTLPDGHAWASLDVDLLQGVITRSATAASVSAHDRGSALFGDPWQLAADSALLAEHGWDWITQPRTATTLPAAAGDGDGDGGRRRDVEIETDDGRAWTVTVESVRRLPVPVCGEPLEAAEKLEDELRVVAIIPHS